ncbi:MAG: transcriptional repressor LexA [Acutalibacteraceae bacterium]
MKPLSDSQQKILKYITECSQNGRSPSVRDICAATGLRSTSTVHSHLKTLKNLGFIDQDEKLNRTIRLANNDPSAAVPIMGKVTAGLPIEAIQDIEGYVPVSESVRRGRELFALRIQGDSMINAGILDGDIVVVNREQTAENGEIVVALIEDEATVKRFYKENGHFRLQPENPSYEPIIVPECSVLGKVIEVIRYY